MRAGAGRMPPGRPGENLLTIELPWPAKVLHPNARTHWGTKRRATKAARTIGHLLARAAEGRNLVIHDGQSPIRIQLIFHPPLPRRKRDEDGMVASCKAYLDGIADGLKVNDACFKLEAPRVLENVALGKVLVEIHP